MNAILAFIRREPALVLGLAAAVITLAAAFGLKLGDQQQAAISALLEVIIAIAIRSQVTPVSKLPAAPAA